MNRGVGYHVRVVRLVLIAFFFAAAGCHRCDDAKAAADHAWNDVILFEYGRGHVAHAELAKKSRERALAGAGDWSNELQDATKWEIAAPGENRFLDLLTHATGAGFRVQKYCR